MNATIAQMTDFIRSIHGRPNGTGALLNLIRASEVRAAADLSALSDIISDDQLKLDLARHASDEARHAFILQRRMKEIGFVASRLPPAVDRHDALLLQCGARDPKRVYAERGLFTEEEVFETLLAFCMAERDAFPKLEVNHAVLASDPGTQAVIGSLIRDEVRHIRYLEEWLERLGKGLAEDVTRAAEARVSSVFAEANDVFYPAFDAYLASAEARLAS
jgi:1,2-phenylacetyl-CoA epoxidase catalytic subunit